VRLVGRYVNEIWEPMVQHFILQGYAMCEVLPNLIDIDIHALPILTISGI
jgi:hypothetical protein